MSETQNQAIADIDQALEGFTPPKVARRESERPAAPRARRQSNLGGARLKLAVHGEIPGQKLYWCNDDGNELAELLSEGFSFVQPEEVQVNRGVVVDKDVDGRISKYVGTKQNGDPMRAYLLKCPQELWDELQSYSQDQADEWDGAILAGAVGSVDNSYAPKGLKTEVGLLARR